MSTIASTSPNNSNSLFRLSVIGGLIIGAFHVVIQVAVVFVLIVKASTLMSGLQYIASGAMGEAAYAGGLGTALLGLILDMS